MEREKKSLYQRIRNARQSLENAEKSFHDDKSMRGELDLMLAEAELKNLRNKQTFPWSWNRNMLAICLAVLLVVASFGGWLFAKEYFQQNDIQPTSNSQISEQQQSSNPVMQGQILERKEISEVQENNKKELGKNIQAENKIQLSEKDMRSLVRKAKSELNSGK